MSWDFYTIMVSIVGAPSTDFECAILYLLSACLGLSLILFVYKLFSIVPNMFTPK